MTTLSPLGSPRVKRTLPAVFRLSPDHSPCYSHISHRAARKRVRRLLADGSAIVLIIGRPGVGKSTLMGTLAEMYQRESGAVISMGGAQIEAKDFTLSLAAACGLQIEGVTHANLRGILRAHLREIAEPDRKAFLFVDDADMFAASSLRVLCNLGGEKSGTLRPNLQIVLAGSPRLETSIRTCGSPRVSERPPPNVLLGPINDSEMRAYLFHRLKRTGVANLISISDAAVSAIHRHCHGIPRSANLIAGRLLLNGAGLPSLAISEEDVLEVVGELSVEGLVDTTLVDPGRHRRSIGEAVEPRASGSAEDLKGDDGATSSDNESRTVSVDEQSAESPWTRLDAAPAEEVVETAVGKEAKEPRDAGVISDQSRDRRGQRFAVRLGARGRLAARRTRRLLKGSSLSIRAGAAAVAVATAIILVFAPSDEPRDDEISITYLRGDSAVTPKDAAVVPDGARQDPAPVRPERSRGGRGLAGEPAPPEVVSRDPADRLVMTYARVPTDLAGQTPQVRSLGLDGSSRKGESGSAGPGKDVSTPRAAVDPADRGARGLFSGRRSSDSSTSSPAVDDRVSGPLIARIARRKPLTVASSPEHPVPAEGTAPAEQPAVAVEIASAFEIRPHLVISALNPETGFGAPLREPVIEDPAPIAVVEPADVEQAVDETQMAEVPVLRPHLVISALNPETGYGGVIGARRDGAFESRDGPVEIASAPVDTGPRESGAVALDREPTADVQRDAELTRTTQVRVERLLAIADDALRQLRLTTPEGVSAHDSYQAVLDIDPDNQRALRGQRQIVDAYIRLTRRAIGQRRLNLALAYLDRAEIVLPGAADTSELRGDILASFDAGGPSERRLAVLPFRTSAPCRWPVAQHIRRATRASVERNQAAQLVQLGSGDEDSGADEFGIWTSGSPRPSPKAEAVYALGREIGADWILLSWIDCPASDVVYEPWRKFVLYLADVRGGRMHVHEGELRDIAPTTEGALAALRNPIGG